MTESDVKRRKEVELSGRRKKLGTRIQIPLLGGLVNRRQAGLTPRGDGWSLEANLVAFQLFLQVS